MNVLDVALYEDLWFPIAASIALIAVAGLVGHYRAEAVSRAVVVICALNLFYGSLIGILGFGHLLAVSITTAMGTSTGRWFLYPLGFAITVPAVWLAASVEGLREQKKSAWKSAIALNAWLAMLLFPLAGPLAAPALVNGIVLWRERLSYPA